MSGKSTERITWIAVISGATLIALVSARPFAGGWNDGSRLAMVETLVDRHTLVINDSIFVKVPRGDSPYENGSYLGTFDKLLIDGQYFSDKSPVPGLLLAIVYQVLQWMTGLTARLHPQVFCYAMTVLSSGAAYVVAVGGVYHLSGRLELPARSRLVVTAGFALGTLALVYVRYVNNHMMLLGVAVALLACHVKLAQAAAPRLRLLVLLGSLAGFAYTIDLGVGPPLMFASVVLAGWRTCSLKSLAVMLLASLPWLATHHAVNLAVGGTVKPANAVPEYLAWPGSPFKDNATGQWRHADALHGVSYAAQLLVGKKGFLGHNLPLLLLLPAVGLLVGKRTMFLPELLFCFAVCAAVWLVYAIGSTNYAGACCSIRWFVPLVGLGFFPILVLLRETPSFTADFVILTVGGVALMASAWPGGPWRMYLLPAYWPILTVTLVAWGVYRWRLVRGRPVRATVADAAPLARAA